MYINKLWHNLINKGANFHNTSFAPKRARALNATLLITAMICLVLAINAFVGGRVNNGWIQVGRVVFLLTSYFMSTKGLHKQAFMFCLFVLILGNFSFIVLQEFNTGNAYSYLVFLVLIYYFLETRTEVILYYLLVSFFGILHYYLEFDMKVLPIQTQLISYISIIIILFFLLKLFFTENRVYRLKMITRQQKMEELNAQLNATLEEAKNNSMELELANAKVLIMQNQLLSAGKIASLTSLSKGALERISNPLNFISGGVGAMDQALGELLYLLDTYRKLPNISDAEEKQRLLLEIKKKEEDLDIEELLQDVIDISQDLRLGLDQLSELMNTLAIFTTKVSPTNVLKNKVDVLIQEAIQKLPEVDQKRVFVEVSPKLPRVEVEPKTFQMALLELLKNALEYTTDKVVVKAWSMGKKWALTLQDIGEGMSEQTKMNALEPFFTLDKTNRHKGLGLTLAYHIILQHKGNLEINSKIGEGTTIYITLPITSKPE
ncbi:MAG: sensor histidine kinase [Flammeovirgaceae bacterium]